MGGHCDAAMMAAGETISQINDGTIIGLAIGSETRNENIPDVPTFLECGSKMVAGAFRGYACPAGVPDDVYQYLVSEFDKIITSDKFIQGMNDAAIPYSYKNAADFQEYANQCSADLAPLVDTLKAGK
jgi:tripartite-type tricarboxylate transporter receptor subunit TctC